MIVNRLTCILIKILIKGDYITNDDIDIYKFGFQLLFTKILHIIAILFLGIILNIIIETVIFIFLFQWIRKYSGGWHAPTDIVCFITSCLFEVMLFLSLKYYSNIMIVDFILVITSLILISKYAPIMSIKNPLTDDEITRNKTKSTIICLLFCCLSIFFALIKLNNISTTVIFVLSISSLLLIIKNNN